MSWGSIFGSYAPPGTIRARAPRADHGHDFRTQTTTSAHAGARVGSVASHPTGRGHAEGVDPATAQALRNLQQNDKFKVKQGLEFGEFLLALECPNGYAVTDANNKPIYAVKEKLGGPIKWFERWFFRQARSFTITVVDTNKKPVLTFKRPLRAVFSKMEVYGPDNKLLGTIQRRFKFFGEKYELRCPKGHHLATVRAWTLGPRHFTVRKGFRKIGKLRKQFAGIFKEGWSKADKYEIQWFPKNVAKLGLDNLCDIQLRALGFSTMFLIDYDAFDA